MYGQYQEYLDMELWGLVKIPFSLFLCHIKRSMNQLSPTSTKAI